MCEECVSFPCGGLTLSGVLAHPEQDAPKYAALICAPHPNFAGNMENNLVMALARAMSRNAMTLRFDYRGIGASEIELPADVSVFDYWDDVEQSKNYADPLADVAAAGAALLECANDLPLVVLGYSFGSIVGLMGGLKLGGVRAMAGIAPPLRMHPFDFLAASPIPCLLVSGEGDFVFSTEESERLKGAWGDRVRQSVLKGEDHFFRDSEDSVCAQVRHFVEQGLKL